MFAFVFAGSWNLYQLDSWIFRTDLGCQIRKICHKNDNDITVVCKYHDGTSYRAISLTSRDGGDTWSKEFLSTAGVTSDNPQIIENRESLLSFFKKKPIVWCDDIKFISDRMNEIFNNTLFEIENDEKHASNLIKEEFLLTGYGFLDEIKKAGAKNRR